MGDGHRRAGARQRIQPRVLDERGARDRVLKRAPFAQRIEQQGDLELRRFAAAHHGLPLPRLFALAHDRAGGLGKPVHDLARDRIAHRALVGEPHKLPAGPDRTGAGARPDHRHRINVVRVSQRAQRGLVEPAGRNEARPDRVACGIGARPQSDHRRQRVGVAAFQPGFIPRSAENLRPGRRVEHGHHEHGLGLALHERDTHAREIPAHGARIELHADLGAIPGRRTLLVGNLEPGDKLGGRIRVHGRQLRFHAVLRQGEALHQHLGGARLPSRQRGALSLEGARRLGVDLHPGHRVGRGHRRRGERGDKQREPCGGESSCGGERAHGGPLDLTRANARAATIRAGALR